MKYLGTYEKNQDIATKEKVETKLSYDATSDTVMQGGADVTEKVAKSLDMYIAPSNIGAVAYTNQELTDEQKQQARTNIGVGDATKDAKGIVQIGDNLNIANGVLSRDKDVFIATYGTTTGAEITAAVNAGKVVLCEKSDINAILTLVGTGENQYWFAGEYSDHRTATYKTARAAIAKTGTAWRYSTTWADAATMLSRDEPVFRPDTNYTTLMARGEKLLDATAFDAVTDWTSQLVNGAIAWRYS